MNVDNKTITFYKLHLLLGTELEPAVTANGFTDIHLPSSNLQETAQQQYCQSNSGINIDQQSVGSFQVRIFF